MDILDLLTRQHEIEVDPVDTLYGDTPLHAAVRHINSQSQDQWETKLRLVDILLEAGADMKMRNKAKLTPVELADPQNKELSELFKLWEYRRLQGSDVVDVDVEDGEGATWSASDDE